MTTASSDVSATTSNKRKITLPPDGYVCNLCSMPGHWIQQCPQKPKAKKQRKSAAATNNHTPVPGVDPSQADIDAAREMQKIPPPLCFCRNTSRLRKVKRSHVSGEQSRAIGIYFFFCSKARDDPTRCKFARAVDDEIKPKKERLCTFFSKNGSCKKGDACKFRHEHKHEVEGKGEVTCNVFDAFELKKAGKSKTDQEEKVNKQHLKKKLKNGQDDSDSHSSDENCDNQVF